MQTTLREQKQSFLGSIRFLRGECDFCHIVRLESGLFHRQLRLAIVRFQYAEELSQ